MDKDLNDAVLAAFRRSVGDDSDEDATASEEGSTPAEGALAEETGSAEETDGESKASPSPSEAEEVPVAVAALAGGKKASGSRVERSNVMKGKSGISRIEGRSSAKSKPSAPSSRTSSASATGEERSPEKTGSVPVHKRDASHRSADGVGSSKLPVLLLALNLILLVLVVVLLVSVNGLVAKVTQQQSTVEEMAKVIHAADLVKMAKLVRVKGGVYHDPKSRPQTVMFVCDEEDGKLKIKQSIVRPLE